ncbi:TerB family tellurite resistance protein [Mucilaginibacter sp. KACC 22773]|uniref:TerB family tellurite resistance protein n=1 Tax=Mucilaginibacter sp. KACC 22773 TaxID=3025671 RepID=UPI002365B02A|nr:TerB family tellurite resistance protein [Mucilaginibacter sp. KACC 22773]WDF81172.1 TerB family tellurite resistance protein [Mucilaginibacter sp. KACC 22773]
MKRINTLRRCGAVLILMLIFCIKANAQSDELQQLLLNIEKLTQFKAILSDMKKGYQIYQQGYGTISNLSKGNFDLHNIYLTGLMAVNPAVRNNPRVGQIMSQQNDLLSEYQRYASLFRLSGTFSNSELTYINNVFSQLVRQSDANIDDLSSVTTAGKLRMSDDDRLRAIDRIYNSSSDQLQFLRFFNRQAVMLSLQRSKDLNDTRTLKRLYKIN